jgi:hypothetical protein
MYSENGTIGKRNCRMFAAIKTEMANIHLFSIHTVEHIYIYIYIFAAGSPGDFP